MTRTTRIIALAGASAVALSLAAPTMAMAADAPVASRGGTSVQEPNELYAGYTSTFKKKKTVTGTVTLPKLGACATDSGILIAIETSDVTGGDYVDGGSYSSCSGGVKTHSIVIESAVGGQILLEDGSDGDKLKVSQTVKKNGDVVVKLDNVTAGTSYTETVVGASVTVATGLHWGTIFIGGVEMPTADIGKSKVTGMKVGGKDLADTKPTKYDFVKGGDTVLKTSKIKKGTDYTVTNVG